MNMIKCPRCNIQQEESTIAENPSVRSKRTTSNDLRTTIKEISGDVGIINPAIYFVIPAAAKRRAGHVVKL